jgi:hypothetical protein
MTEARLARSGMACVRKRLAVERSASQTTKMTGPCLHAKARESVWRA